jgi:hypothetical protein
MSDKIYSIVKADIRKEVMPLKKLRKITKKVATNNNRVYPTCNRNNTVIKSVTTGARKSPNLPNYYNNGEHMISRLTLIISIIAFVLSVYNLLVILEVL